MDVRSLIQKRGEIRAAAKALGDVVVKGVPAVRAAVHSARIATGAKFSTSVLEKLGVQVVPLANSAVVKSLAKKAGEAALVFERGGNLLRAGAKEWTLHAKDGLTLRVARAGNVAAAVSQEAVEKLAKDTIRTSVTSIGKSALQGAAAGALLDSLTAGAGGIVMLVRSEIDGKTLVAKMTRAAVRGAIVGGVSVAAAGAVSAVVAATGVSVVGVPIVLPVATMVVSGAIVGAMFDRVYPEVAEHVIAVQG